MQEFKVGDRVQLEGAIVHVDSEYIGVQMRGDTAIDFDTITPAAMAHARLIEPAVKAAEEKALDLSKPVRVKSYPDKKVVSIFGPNSRGFYMVEFGCGTVDLRFGGEIENIPEPKKTTTQEVYLHEYANGSRFFSGYVACAALISKARITHSEGAENPWAIEEVR